MKMRNPLVSALVLLACTSPFVHACDSNGGIEGGQSISEQTNPDLSSSLSPNRDLQGYLATIYRSQLWKTDLPSGEMTKFPRVSFEDDPAFHNLSRFQIDNIGVNSSGFLLGVASCYSDVAASLSCVQFLDKDGESTLTFYFSYQISIFADTIVSSNNGSRFAVLTTLPGRIFLRIYSRSGEPLGSQKINVVSYDDIRLDWGINDVLYMTRADEGRARIYYWNPGDSEFSGHYDFDYDGHIREIKTSPNERKIAFELANSNSSIYIADLDSGEAYRLVQPDDSYPNQFFSSPMWSPDGSWILAQHHNEESVQHGLAPYSLIAIPADARDLIYDLNDNSETAVPFKISDNSHQVLGPNSQTSWFRGGTVFWLAD